MAEEVRPARNRPKPGQPRESGNGTRMSSVWGAGCSAARRARLAVAAPGPGRAVGRHVPRRLRAQAPRDAPSRRARHPSLPPGRPHATGECRPAAYVRSHFHSSPVVTSMPPTPLCVWKCRSSHTSTTRPSNAAPPEARELTFRDPQTCTLSPRWLAFSVEG